MDDEESTPTLYKCPQCDLMFDCLLVLDNHLKFHTKENPYECEVCHTSFLYQTYLEEHLTLSPECGGTSQVTEVETDAQNGDSMVNVSESISSDSQIDQKSTLINSEADEFYMVLVENKKMFRCAVCQKDFKRKSHAKEHAGTVHTNARKYQCPHCNINYKNKSQLNAHIRCKHTDNRTGIKCKLSDQIMDGTQRECDICGAVISRISFRQHLLRHTDKRHACDQCDKSYVSKHHLIVHQMGHTGERPFPCTFPGCDNRLRTKNAYNRHMAVHAGIKNHYCSYCGKGFFLVGGLNQHVKIHTNDPTRKRPSRSKSAQKKCNKMVQTSNEEPQQEEYKTILEKIIKTETVAEYNNVDVGEHSANIFQIIDDTSSNVKGQINNMFSTINLSIVKLEVSDEYEDVGVAQENVNYIAAAEESANDGRIISYVENVDADAADVKAISVSEVEDSKCDVEKEISDTHEPTCTATVDVIEGKIILDGDTVSADAGNDVGTSVDAACITDLDEADNIKSNADIVIVSGGKQFVKIHMNKTLSQKIKHVNIGLADEKNLLDSAYNEVKEIPDALKDFYIYDCRYCPENFRFYHALIKHYTSVHPTLDIHKCFDCGQVFDCQRVLKKHCKDHHDGNSCTQCKVCNKMFIHPGQLTEHVEKHTSGKLFSCEVCDKQFKNNSELSNHLLSHPENKPIECKECGHRFVRKRDFIIHYRLHTGVSPFKCDKCDKEFRSEISLRYHSRVHAAVRPFPCGECNKSYTTRSKLMRHTRNHTGNKPFKCLEPGCDKSYVEVRDYRYHQMKHRGEKPHRCPVCSKAFLMLSNMEQHHKTHFKLNKQSHSKKIISS
ncbi:zinc finger protein 320 [Patella vulgata]|uniref:zinc finger protein 320 n=1 Tax=Patella vulgata TaxID=6465 RepID=UPI0024A8B9EA|nr:zinc finger protein 320 [Patella vulgata]XP_050416436.2 zinc finger protein 320 [Patella vulgata]